VPRTLIAQLVGAPSTLEETDCSRTREQTTCRGRGRAVENRYGTDHRQPNQGRGGPKGQGEERYWPVGSAEPGGTDVRGRGERDTALP